MTLGCTMLQFCACLCSMSHVFSCEHEVEVDGRTPGPSHDIGLYLGLQVVGIAHMVFVLKLSTKDMLFNYGAFPQTWEDPKHVSEDTGCPGDNVPCLADDRISRRT